MKRLFALPFFLFSIVLFAQQQPFSVEPYAKNIVKISLLPSKGWRNENVSDAVILGQQHLDDAFSVHYNDSTLVVNKKVRIRAFDSAAYKGLVIELTPGEKIFGAGERALPLNRRGYRLNLYNAPWYGYGQGADNLNYSVPFVMSSSGYGLLFDNPAKGFLDIGKTHPDALEFGAVSGEINVYLIFGDYQTILQSYYQLTGTQPLPPRWALGNFMSRFGYTSQAQVKEIYAKMKAGHIPVDAVIFDLFWFGDSIKHTLGNLAWVNKKAWPDPKGMIADFAKDSVKTILVTEPFFLEETVHYNGSKPFLAINKNGKPYTLTDFYFGRGGLIDIFRSDAQNWFWQLYKKQMRQNGVEAWWGDLGEPEKHPADMYHRVFVNGSLQTFGADEVHNLYGHQWTKMLYQQLANDYPNKRLFSLNRAGFAGTQRYSIFPWTGDVSRSWSGYRAQLPVLLGMSMSGVPYVHSDAGGFAGGEGDNELYVRWLQFAAFTPIMRPHGTALYEKDTGAFSFPSEAALFPQPYRTYAKNAILLRYSLLPYNYTLAYQQATAGKPLMAPLYYFYPADTTAVKTEDEYLWGENILVAPVLEKGAQTRRVYLPAGRWFNLMRNQVLDGGRWTTDSVSLAMFPLYIKAGSFVPFTDIPHNAATYKGTRLKVMYVPADSATAYVLFNDDGVSKNSLAAKQYELLTFSSSGLQGNGLTLRVASNGGTYAGKPLKRQIRFTLPNEGRHPQKVWINNRPAKSVAAMSSSLPAGTWMTTPKETTIETAFTGKPVTIRMAW